MARLIVRLDKAVEEPSLVFSTGLAEKPLVNEPLAIGPDVLQSSKAELDPATLPSPAITPLTDAERTAIGELAEAEGKRVIGLGGVFSGRTGEAKLEALRAGGGTGASEGAVGHGLSWLARHQQSSGAWSFVRFPMRCPQTPHCTGAAKLAWDWAQPAATGLAVLCFLGAGNTHLQGPYAAKVGAGIHYLIRIQDGTGRFGAVEGQFMYNQAICTLALAEAYGMTGDPKIGLAAQRGVDFIQSSQNPDGGWRYVPGEAPSDSSVTGWQVMALKSGQLAGLRVKPEVLQGTRKWFDSVTDEQGRTHYRTLGDRTDVTPALTAVSLLVKLYTGTEPGAPSLQQPIRYILSCPPAWSEKLDRESLKRMDEYFWYYATMALYMLGGKAWQEWNPKVRDLLVARQRQTGCEKGSWDPVTLWSHYGGRLYTTAVSILILEVYYRYLPIYRTTEPPDPIAVSYGQSLRAFEAFAKSESSEAAAEAEKQLLQFLELIRGKNQSDREERALLRLATLYEKTGRPEKVIEAIEERGKHFSKDGQIAALGLAARAYAAIARRANDQAKALDAERRSLLAFSEIAFSTDNTALMEAAASRAAARGLPQIATADYEWLLARYRSREDSQEQAWKTVARLADCYTKLERWKDAQFLYKCLAARYKDSRTALVALAASSEKIGAAAEALQAYQKLIRFEKENTPGWWELKLKEFELRIKLGEKAAVRKELGLLAVTRAHLVPQELQARLEQLRTACEER